MKKIFFLLCIITISSCNTAKKELTAQDIIDKSISTSNTDLVANAEISFNFRDRAYRAYRANGLFSLERITKKGDSITKDVLSNNGFMRYVDEKPFSVPDSMAIKYSESVNSVHYFSVLPYGLNDKAVQKELLEETIINGKEYYKIKVTFQQEGGGIDYQDVFVYWIDKESFKIGYLAYKFHVNGGGVRFREVIKDMNVSGIRFVNYANYKSKNVATAVADLDKDFINNNLILLSEVNLENINVHLKK